MGRIDKRFAKAKRELQNALGRSSIIRGYITRSKKIDLCKIITRDMLRLNFAKYPSFYVCCRKYNYRFAVRPASSKAAMISVSFVFDGE